MTVMTTEFKQMKNINGGTAANQRSSSSSNVGWMMTRSAVQTTILLVPLLSIMTLIIGGISKHHGNSDNNVAAVTIANAEDVTGIIPLDDIVQISAFDKRHYKSITDEPYKSYPCMPRKIHLSQGNNVNSTTNLVSMYISFTLNYDTCQNAKPRIIYGQNHHHYGIIPSSSSFLDEKNNNLGSIEKLNFTYVSPKTKEHYQSDWIYHARLDNLDAGLTEYWYRIVVDENNTDEEEQEGTHDSHKKSNSNLASSVSDSISSSTATQQERRRTRRHESRSLLFWLRGLQNRVGETPTYTFKTPPLVVGQGTNNSVTTPTNLALVGDIGQTENSCKTMNHILTARNAPVKHPISAIIIAGDLSYADSDPHRWESWLDLMEPLLRTTPLQTAPGNHEIECDHVSHDIFVPFENLFRNPNRIGPPDMVPVDDAYRKTLWSCTTPSEFLGHYNFGNAFYSFVHGLAHIIVLNSYTDTSVGSSQYNWLQNELETNVDRNVTPWLLVIFHCPLHTTFSGHNNEKNSKNMLQSMEPLFVKYHVNIVVSGHDHAYLRTHSMIGSKLDVFGNGPIYFTLGAGGNREGHSKYIHRKPEPWVAKRDNSEFGFGNLFLANHTHAHFSWVRDGTTEPGVQDDVWLKNQLLVPTRAAH